MRWAGYGWEEEEGEGAKEPSGRISQDMLVEERANDDRTLSLASLDTFSLSVFPLSSLTEFCGVAFRFSSFFAFLVLYFFVFFCFTSFYSAHFFVRFLSLVYFYDFVYFFPFFQCNGFVFLAFSRF